MYTEDKQALRHRKSVLSIPPPNDTKRHLINCALTPAHKHRRACRETSTHRHKHIFQPTPAWTHSCAAGLSFSVCDVFAHCFTGGHQRRSSPLLKGGRGGRSGVTVNHYLPRGLPLLARVSKGGGEVDYCFLSLSNHKGCMKKTVTSRSIAYSPRFPEYEKYTAY